MVIYGMQHHEEGDCIRFKDQIVAVCIGSPGHTSTTEKEGSGIHTVCSYKYYPCLSMAWEQGCSSLHTHIPHTCTHTPPPPHTHTHAQADLCSGQLPLLLHTTYGIPRSVFPGRPHH